MIMMDIPEPKKCEDCPCAYWIQTGEYEGLMMCNAMEFKSQQSGFHEEITRYFVAPEDHRPEGCPIRLVEVSK